MANFEVLSIGGNGYTAAAFRLKHSDLMKYPNLESVLTQIQNVTEFSNAPLVDVNQRGFFGNSPLVVAISWDDTEAVNMLLNCGADVNAKLEDSHTPLHYAALFGHAEIAKLLLEKGASRTSLNDWGKTPAEVARGQGRLELADLLQ